MIKAKDCVLWDNLMQVVPPVASARLLNRVVTLLNPSAVIGLEDDVTFPGLKLLEDLSPDVMRLSKAEIATLKDKHWNVKQKPCKPALAFLDRFMHARAQLMLAGSATSMEDLIQKFHEGLNTACS